jgi:hypothetical protein
VAEPDLSDLVERLQAIEEELADRAIAVLRDAVEAGASGRPEAERRITRARAAVAKAITLLDGRPGRDADDD